MNISTSNVREYGYRKIRAIFGDRNFYKEVNRVAYVLSNNKVSSFTMLSYWGMLGNKEVPHLSAIRELVDTYYNSDVESLANRKNFAKVYLSHFRRFAKVAGLTNAEAELLLKVAVLIPVVHAGLSTGIPLDDYILFVDEDIQPSDLEHRIHGLARYFDGILRWGIRVDQLKENTEELLDILVLTDNNDFVNLLCADELSIKKIT